MNLKNNIIEIEFSKETVGRWYNSEDFKPENNCIVMQRTPQNDEVFYDEVLYKNNNFYSKGKIIEVISWMYCYG